MRQQKCLRCGTDMAFLMQEKFQKGDMGAWVGNVNFSMRGGLEMAVYACPKCGKIEFFTPNENDIPEQYGDQTEIQPETNIVGVSADGVPQVKCPRCGRQHDFDYPKCIYCDFDYYA